MQLLFEWDETKDRKNRKRHRVSFEEAKTVFNDPLSVTYLDEKHLEIEERFFIIGVSANNRTLLVIHTVHEVSLDQMRVRIISCRKATRLERMAYEEAQK